MSVLRVIDDGEPIEFEFADLRKYHGTRSICGLTVAFKVMQRGFAVLGRGEPLPRGTLAVRTAFPGPGARDAFELVTRAATRDRYTVDKSVGPSERIAEAANGAYHFRISSAERTVELGVRPSVIDAEFIRLRRRQLAGSASADELARFRDSQLRLSAMLLPMDPAEVVDVLGTSEGP